MPIEGRGPLPRLALALLLAGFLGSAGCGGGCCDGPLPGPGGPPAQAPDFSLQDLNPNSGTYLGTVSPRDFTGQVSAWYFGYAT